MKMRSQWRSSVLLFSVVVNWPNSVIAAAAGLAGGAWRAYSSALHKYPVRTNALTCGTLQVGSDALAQKLQPSESAQASGLDLTRSITMMGWGSAIGGIVVYRWLRFLDKLFPPEKNTLLRVLAKISVNQAVMAPAMNGGFFGVATARNHVLTSSHGRTGWLKEWDAKVKVDLLPSIVKSTSFWGPVQFVNFYMVPPYARTLYVNGALFTWSVYLSLVGYRRVQLDQK